MNMTYQLMYFGWILNILMGKGKGHFVSSLYFLNEGFKRCKKTQGNHIIN